MLVDAEVSDLLDLDSLDVESLALESLDAESLRDFELAVTRRSFFAQPEPLNTTAGALRAFVIRPSAPHDGQKRGPSA